MEERERKRLKKVYSEMSDEELLEMLSIDRKEYEKEIYILLLEEAGRREFGKNENEILQKARTYKDRIEKIREKRKDVFGTHKLKQAFKKKDYYSIGKLLFSIVIFYSFLSGITTGSSSLMLLEIIFTIAIFGIIPVIFFLVYSFKLSSTERKKRNLSLFMPKYVFFTYLISLFISFIFIILPRL